MASYSAVVTYDPSVLKSTDKKIPNGTSSYRFDPAGKISLAVIYDAIEGMDFTDYTLVCTLTFEALTSPAGWLRNCRGMPQYLTKAFRLTFKRI